MKFEKTKVMNFEGAFRGMRNPLESWNKSDSDFSEGCHFAEYDDMCESCPYFAGFGEPCLPKIGENDLNLAKRLIKGGSEHRKFLRQIFISVDITAPLYWWKEFDTYKIGTTANSTSTMHKVQSKPITLECFEIDDLCNVYFDDEINNEIGFGGDVEYFIQRLEKLRQQYLETKDKRYWKELIRWLPESWLQTRTITMNYENVRNIYFQRRNHKLTEWSDSFIKWVESLPYAKELITYTGE